MNKRKSIYFSIIAVIVIALTAFLFIIFDSNNVYHSSARVRTISHKTNRVIHRRIHTKYRQHGELLVPSCHIHLPITNGTGNNMLVSAGKLSNRKMGHGNYVLFSHHMRSNSVLFSPLYHHAKRGTRICLTNFHHTYVYSIYSRKVIPATDTKVVNNTRHPIISLITCTKTLGGNHRLLLKGRLIKRYRFNRTPRRLIKDMEKKTNNRDVLAGY